jgi:hypothetical protein
MTEGMMSGISTPLRESLECALELCQKFLRELGRFLDEADIRIVKDGDTYKLSDDPSCSSRT